MSYGTACVEESCSRKGVQVFTKQMMCKSCGGELFPVEETEPTPHMLDDMSYSDDMLERMSAFNFTHNRSNVTPIIIKADDTFHCTPDLKGCPIAEKPAVYIPIDMYNKWIFLANQLSTEWIAYLIGKQKEGEENKYEITDMYFPEQNAGGAHVEAKDGQIKEDVVAAVHSHVGMNVFFSSTDETHFNHNIELVVNNKGEILATGRSKLECGRYHRGPADIIFVDCEEELALEEDLKKKLTTRASTFTTVKSKVDGQQTLLGI